MRSIDTNVLVRLMTRDDRTQVAAAEEFVRPGGWVSHLVLMEAVWVLDTVYDVKADRVATGIETLLDHDTIAVQDPEVVHAAVRHYRKHPGLGFSDCLILEVARHAGHLPLGTFDRGLSRLPGAQRLLSGHAGHG